MKESPEAKEYQLSRELGMQQEQERASEQDWQALEMAVKGPPEAEKPAKAHPEFEKKEEAQEAALSKQQRPPARPLVPGIAQATHSPQPLLHRICAGRVLA